MIEKGDFDIDRIVTPKETQAETTDDFEVSLRPKTLDEYIGQEKVKENLKIYIQAAKDIEENAAEKLSLEEQVKKLAAENAALKADSELMGAALEEVIAAVAGGE